MLGERVLQVWRWYLQRFRRYRKKTRGGARNSPPPPSGARVKYKILNIFFDAPVVLCPSFGSMERLRLWRFIYGAHKQINGVLKARSQCWLTLIANDDARLHLSIASRISRKNKKNKIIILLRASAKREASFYWYTLKIWVWAARRPWSRFWEAHISGTVSPIDKRSSLVGNPIPSAVHGTNAESCQCLLWHVARATWGDVTNVPPAISR